jgi:hypothetical protein
MASTAGSMRGAMPRAAALLRARGASIAQNNVAARQRVSPLNQQRHVHRST